MLILTIWGGLVFTAKSQSTDDVLNLLIQKNVVSQKDADSIRAEAAIASQANLAKVKAFPINAGKKITIAGTPRFAIRHWKKQAKLMVSIFVAHALM